MPNFQKVPAQFACKDGLLTFPGNLHIFRLQSVNINLVIALLNACGREPVWCDEGVQWYGLVLRGRFFVCS